MANEMTNEEAIAYIQEWLKDEYALNSKDRKVLNMAVEALSQEPCEDAISRKDLLSQAWFVTGDDFPIEGLEYITKGMVENMPSVNPQPKTGHWIEYKPGHHRCSNCHKDAFVKWSPSKRDNVDVLTNCCPNCGAKMVESEDKE